MKWYFASNDKSEKYYDLIKVALNSCLQNTTLQPHCIFDGAPNTFTEWLENKGVKIIYHEVSFKDLIYKNNNQTWQNVASGAFLRCELPLIEEDDDFVLYTDCDVLFLKDFVCDIKPEYFACSSQFRKNDFTEFNTGIMVMNIKNLRKTYPEFLTFLKTNLYNLPAFDQSAYQIFYNRKNTKLSTIFNHKPYWGINKNAVILHFHGPKPYNFYNRDTICDFSNEKLAELYIKNKKSYKYYLELFKNYSDNASFDFEYLEQKFKGKSKSTISQNSIFKRIKNRINKEFRKISNQFNKCK